MILIDSLYINAGGGIVLLKYLVKELQKHQIKFRMIVDERAQSHFVHVKDKMVMRASLSNRQHFYNTLSLDFTSVFCFGNIPPTRKLNVPVYTYYHNVNMLTLKGWPDLKTKMAVWAKREYIKTLRRHTDYWFVQTENTATEVYRHLDANWSKIQLYPFYELPEGLESLSQATERNDYALVGNYNFGAKGHDQLCDAWVILKERGLTPRLHITISDDNVVFLTKVKRLCDKGVNIINHGIVPFNETVSIYAKTKAVVYPSLNESLGLGIIEAIHGGCDIIASDLPFAWSICNPSAVFDRESPESIADAVMDYEKGKTNKTTIKINNMIEQLIQVVTTVS